MTTEPSASEAAAVTAAPQIVGIYDDVGPQTGYFAAGSTDGLFTNDAAPVVRVAIGGTAASAGTILNFSLVYGGGTVGPAHVVTADEAAEGFALVQLNTLADGQYPVIVNVTGSDGTLLQTGYVTAINVATHTPATPYIAGFFDDSAGQWQPVSNETADQTPIVRVFMPGISESQEPHSPGHPPFGNPNPIVGGKVQLYADGVAAGTGTINFYGYVDFNASTLTPGEHVLTVAAIDKAGNVSSQSAPVTLNISSGGKTITGTDAGEELVGTTGDDRIEGLGGNDAISGGIGADVLIGGLGDDWYYVRDQLDQIVENPGEGWDNVWATTDFTLPDNVENLYLANATYTGDLNYDGTGNELGNQLIGNDFTNALTGLGGNDEIAGRGGDDVLVGGAGDDYLEGGAGRDVFVFAPGDGHDRVADFVAGEDQLDFTAFGDDPEYELVQTSDGWSFHFASGEQVDVVTTGELTAGVDYVIGGQAGPGGELNLIQGGDDGETLVGTDGDDRIEGGGGNDAMAGGGGHDVLAGGAGDDWYYLNDDSDTIVEEPGEGWDNVWTTVSFVLPDNVENIYLAGDAAIDAVGNGLGNQLAGNDAANTIEGRGGDDLIRGGGGADRYVFGQGDGHDVILDFAVGEDQIVWRGEVGDWTVSDDNGDALIALGGGDTIRLVGLSAADLPDSIFAA